MSDEKITEEHFIPIVNGLKHDIDFIAHLAETMEKSPHRPNGKEDAKKYRIAFGRMFHEFSVQTKLAMMFGIDEADGSIKVIDTKQLPSVEETSKMSEEEITKRLKDAEVDGRMYLKDRGK